MYSIMFLVILMKRFIKYFKKYRLVGILAPLFKLLEAGIDLLVPLVVSSIIDKGIIPNDVNYIYKCVLVMVGLAIIGLVFSISGQYFAAKTAVGVCSKMKVDLFKKGQRLSQSQIDEISSSSLVNRMTSDMNQIQNGINLFLRLFLRSPFIVFGAAILALSISPLSSLGFWISIPILSIIICGITIITLPMHKNVQENVDDVLNSTKENLTGVRVIRAFGNENSEKEKYFYKTASLRKKQMHVGAISSLMNPLTYIVINIAICYLIYIGAIKVDSGALTQGQVIALYNYMSQILVELIKLANLIVTLTKSIASQKRVGVILDMESSLIYKENETTSKEGFVVFDNVSMRYEGNSEDSISNISFQVKKGQTIGIIGGTGSGKSTIVNLIPHLYDPSEGNVYIDGKSIQSYSNEELRSKIGIVLQKASLFKGTIKENVSWGKKNATDEEVYRALEIAQAGDIVSKKEDGINSKVEQLGRNYSGGQKQRLSIARAIIKNPEILILDDSSSALDYATDASLRKAIKKLKTTIFIVSQRTSSVQEADQIIVLDDGKMMGIGTHEELLKNNEIYQEIYYSQFNKEDK